MSLRFYFSQGIQHDFRYLLALLEEVTYIQGDGFRGEGRTHSYYLPPQFSAINPFLPYIPNSILTLCPYPTLHLLLYVPTLQDVDAYGRAAGDFPPNCCISELIWS